MNPEIPEDHEPSEPNPVPPTNSMVKVVTKAASLPKAQPFILKPQISAPSYLTSLQNSPLPPFKRPGAPIRPSVVLGTIVTEDIVVDMVLASEHDRVDGMGKYLAGRRPLLNIGLPQGFPKRTLLRRLHPLAPSNLHQVICPPLWEAAAVQHYVFRPVAATREHFFPIGYLNKLLIDKNITEKYEIPERKFLISFLLETVKYAAKRDFSALKLSCLLTIYIRVHQYFKWYYWTPPTAIWAFFKELMIRHTIEDSPSGQDVFDPEDAYDIVTHFHTNYLTNLPLVHLITFKAHRIKFEWPFHPKK